MFIYDVVDATSVYVFKCMWLNDVVMFCEDTHLTDSFPG